jgi:predicted dehydrogenase
MAAPITAAVVGAGAIGVRLDVPGVATPLTHAGGYRAAGFSLAALVDPDAETRELANLWSCRAYSDFDEMMRVEAPQVVSFAVSTAARADLLRRALSYRPAVVVAEKPLTSSAEQAEEIVAAYRRAAVPLLVNFSRRFVPAWQQLGGANALSTTIRYAKGVRHNGVHAIDLCRMLFGECLLAQSLASKSDYWPDDATVSAFLRFERCPEVFLQGLDERCFTLFEVDIVASDWRVVVDSDGRRVRRFAVRDHAGIPPGKRLVEAATEDTGAASAMLNLMHHVREVLAGAKPLSSGEDAVAAQRIADRLAA